MGNLIVSASSVFIPLFNELVTIPYIYSPLRWGGIPWSPPSQIMVGLIRVIANIILLVSLATISGMMTTERACRRIRFWNSIKRSSWVIMGYMIGNIVATLVPIIKAPVLALSTWIPYASWIVHGAIVAAFIMLFGAIGNAYQRSEVCGAEAT